MSTYNSTNHPQPPPVPPDSPPSTSVRRHHTISSSSRAARAKAPISEEGQDAVWNQEDEVFSGEKWIGAGIVGSGLHRQSSLPSRYNRGFNPSQTGSGRRSGTNTPRTLNSLTAITAGSEADAEEADWEKEISEWKGDEQREMPPPPQDEQSTVEEDYVQADPLTSANASNSGVRRHQSLTYGAHQAKQRASAPLKRSGTMLATASRRSAQPPPEIQDEAEEEEYVQYQDQGAQEDIPHFPQLESQILGQPQHPNRQSPWGPPEKDWRNTSNSYGLSPQMDDVQRALATLDLSQAQAAQQMQPPRFNARQPGLRDSTSNSHLRQSSRDVEPGGNFTQYRGLVGRAPGAHSPHNTVSAHALRRPASASGDNGSPFPGGDSDRHLRSRMSNPNLQYAEEREAFGSGSTSPMPPVPQIPSQYLNQVAGAQPPRLGPNSLYSPAYAHNPVASYPSNDAMMAPVVDIPSLIAAKGYNPVNFDTKPTDARYFVIKSYTEDDVHKSLKYEIWSSTDPGNKRLDKAFKECGGRGPIYLFFSVNASGHFCGVAEMLTPLDYSRSSTVWASDKWKGVFKVKWIFVRDIPNSALRHIKLLNTQERKPVTNSRDTQELLPEAGQEMLRIFHTHPARTSLLQDFGFYELQSLQKHVQGGANDHSPPQAASPVSQNRSPHPQYPQHPYAMTNSAALAYTQQQQYPVGSVQGVNSMDTSVGYAQQSERERTISRSSNNYVSGPYNGRF